MLGGPLTLDGLPVERDPNSALLTYAFQQASGPLQPRPLESRHRALLTLTPNASKSNSNPGPIGSLAKLSNLVESRLVLLEQEERAQRRDKKRRKREEQARIEAANASAAVGGGVSGAADASTGDNKITLNLAALTGKKRKADEDSGEPNEEKKKVSGTQSNNNTKKTQQGWSPIAPRSHPLIRSLCYCCFSLFPQKKKSKQDLVI